MRVICRLEFRICEEASTGKGAEPPHAQGMNNPLSPTPSRQLRWSPPVAGSPGNGRRLMLAHPQSVKGGAEVAVPEGAAQVARGVAFGGIQPEHPRNVGTEQWAITEGHKCKEALSRQWQD
jgi:hypothetical protein